MTVRIGINALCYSARRAGVSNYAYQLVKHLTSRNPEFSYIVFVPFGCQRDFSTIPGCRCVPIPTMGLVTRVVAEQTLVPLLVSVLRIDILHSIGNVCPIAVGRRNIVTVHDVYFVHDPSRFSALKRRYLQLMVGLSARVACYTICVSNYTAGDLQRHFSVPPERLRVIYEGLGGDNHGQSVSSPPSIHARKPYFLFVGTIEPGKNLARLLDALSLLPTNYSLVIVGKLGWNYAAVLERAQKADIATRVLFAGYVDDRTLANLYSNALALVLPSLHEGFGLPVVEAMHWGCPVCCSNTSCLPEIVQDAAILFDPTSIDSVAASMRAVADSPNLRQALITKGHARALAFSWEQCAEQTLGVYQQCRQVLNRRQAGGGAAGAR